MADFSATRQWWPNELVDEVIPAGRTRPEDWLKPDDIGVTLIYDDDDIDGTIVVRMEPGREVEFIWQEDRGSVEILLMPNGAWSMEDPRDGGTIDMFTGDVAKPKPPAVCIEEANWFAAAGDYETMMDSMDGFATCYAENEPSIAPEGLRLTVDMVYWSDPILFRVSADGKSLEAVDGIAHSAMPQVPA